MKSFKVGIAALFAFVCVALAPASSVAFSFEQIDKIQLITAAHADEAPAPAVSPAPALGDKIGDVGDKLGSAADKIPSDGMPITVLAMVVAFIYDQIRRRWPTKNPASLWHDAKAVLNGISKLLAGAGKLLGKIGEVGDKVLGQNVK